MFIGKQTELTKLNKMYETDQFEFAVIYGRRRVGKTTLIKELCKGKKVIYFVAREANDLINIENLNGCFCRYFKGIRRECIFLQLRKSF